MKNLLNFYSSPVCYMWLVLALGGDDLRLEEMTVDAVGDAPKWLREEGIWSLVEVPLIPHASVPFRNSSHGFSSGLIEWGLREGIAPFQPFLVRIEKPRWYQSWPDGEWDEEINTTVERVHPLPAKRLATSWVRAMCAIHKYRERAEVAVQQLDEQRKADVDAMYVSRRTFESGEVMASLCSIHRQTSMGRWSMWPELVSTRSKESSAVAMEHMLKLCAEKLPHVPQERIRAMKITNQWM